MIKDIVFDFGGVLTLLAPEEALQRFRSLGVENPEEYINAYCQQGPFFKVENGDITAEGFCKELENICHRDISFDDAKHAWMGFIAGVHEEILEYLQQLRRNYRLSVLSNTNPFIQSWACTPEFTSGGKSIGDFFDALFYSFQMKASKPGEEIYRKMLLEGNMKPEETLFIDDSDKNIATAQKLGIKTLKVKNGEDWRMALEIILSAEL